MSSLKSLLSPPGGPASLWNRFPRYFDVVCGRVCLYHRLYRLLLQVAPSSSIVEPDLPLALKLRFQCVSVCLHLGQAENQTCRTLSRLPSRAAVLCSPFLVLVFSWPTRLRRCLIFGVARGVYCRIYKMLQNYQSDCHPLFDFIQAKWPKWEFFSVLNNAKWGHRLGFIRKHK